MTLQLALYRALTTLAEPAASLLVEKRLRAGKERSDRVAERYGRTSVVRPSEQLIWMHGASVGESRLLLDLFAALRISRPQLHAVVTTQTLTSADLVARANAPGVIHQMAPMDGPGAVKRFLDHWRPDAVVFAEGEIWPNMLAALRRRNIPAALVNARMTARSLANWNRRRATTRELFSTFYFIGAADRATAEGLASATAREISVVGNLKLAAPVHLAPASLAAEWRAALGDRLVLVAASTHPGEDEFALDAFAAVRARHPDALLIIAPRHPDRGPAITGHAAQRGYNSQQRSNDATMPGSAIDVFVADTLGELALWFAISDGVYLGGATAEEVGGHNAIEPLAAGRAVATGPHGYNFREVFEDLRAAGVLVIVSSSPELGHFWLSAATSARHDTTPDRIHTTLTDVNPTLHNANSQPTRHLIDGARAKFEATIAAINTLLDGAPAHA